MGLFTSDTKTNPFADAEKHMNHKMMEAEGETPDETFVRKMIEHHRGAMEMGRIALQEGPDPELREIIRKSQDEQENGVKELESWLKQKGKASQ